MKAGRGYCLQLMSDARTSIRDRSREPQALMAIRGPVALVQRYLQLPDRVSTIDRPSLRVGSPITHRFPIRSSGPGYRAMASPSVRPNPSRNTTDARGPPTAVSPRSCVAPDRRESADRMPSCPP